MKEFKLVKKEENREITGLIIEPKKGWKGIVIIAHGMAENKERYLNFIEFLAQNGYIAIVYDHLGHGINTHEEDLGYFGRNKEILALDLVEVLNDLKKQYPNVSVNILGHSMGSLVVRQFLQKHDYQIKKCIVCGPPTYNPFSFLGKRIASILTIFHGERYRSAFLNKLVFGSYNKKNTLENAWICTDEKVVKAYNESNRCGFIFTINGFQMLFFLMASVFKRKNYKMTNPNLPLFIIGGEDDQVIGGKKKFNHLIQFLKKCGYQNIQTKLYKNKRHELLNEVGKEEIYQDILNFLDK